MLGAVHRFATVLRRCEHASLTARVVAAAADPTVDADAALCDRAGGAVVCLVVVAAVRFADAPALATHAHVQPSAVHEHASLLSQQTARVSLLCCSLLCAACRPRLPTH